MMIRYLAGAALALCLATPAFAQDTATDPAAAQDTGRTGIRQGDVLLRLRGILVAPNDSSGGVTPTFPAEHVGVNNAVMPELDATYMATDTIGFELIASTTRHTASGKTGTTGSIGDLAKTWVLPPTLTAQYHFNPHGAIRPYVGAGINYTIFWNSEATPGLQAAVGKTHVGLSDSVGWAAQAGIDVDITPRVFVNLDAKYIDMKTTAYLDTAALGQEQVRVHIDPLVFGIGVGLRL